MYKRLFFIIIFLIGFSNLAEAQSDEKSNTSSQLVLNKNPKHTINTDNNKTIIVHKKLNKVDNSKIINHKSSTKNNLDTNKVKSLEKNKLQITRFKKTNSTGNHSDLINNSKINKKESLNHKNKKKE